MVPAMEGDKPKCYPEKALLTGAALGRGICQLENFVWKLNSGLLLNIRLVYLHAEYKVTSYNEPDYTLKKRKKRRRIHKSSSIYFCNALQ
jgi:hypothetical protein